MLKTMSAVRVDECVFPGRSAALSHMAGCRVLIALGRTNISAHGFRSTFRDSASETTTYSREVAEMALAHAISSDAEALTVTVISSKKAPYDAGLGARLCDPAGAGKAWCRAQQSNNKRLHRGSEARRGLW